jgi:hypothetical protein
VQDLAVGEEVGKALVELRDGIRLVEAEMLAGELGAVAESVPDLALEVLLAAEKDGARLVAQHHDEHRFGLAEAGEVVEAAVPPVVVVGIGVARALRRGGQDHDAVLEGFREARDGAS